MNPPSFPVGPESIDQKKALIADISRLVYRSTLAAN